MGRMTSLFYEMENEEFMFETTNQIHIFDPQVYSSYSINIYKL